MPTKPWWESDPVAPSAQADGDWWTRDALDPGFVKGPTASAIKPTFLESLGAKFRSGLARGRSLTSEAIGDALPDLRSADTRATEDTVARGLGYPDDAAQERTQKAVRIAQGERRAQGLDRETDAMARGNREIADAEGFGESARAIFRNPQAVAGTVAESMGMMAPGMAAAVAGGPVGAAAVGSQSYAIEHESTIRDTLAQAGVDLTDPTAVRQALENPELMAEARRRGTARAIPVAAFDALTAGLAGRLIAGARGAGSAVVRTGGELGMQAAGGMAGETGGQLAADQRITSPSDILMEGVAEVPTEITEAPGNYRRAREAAHRAADGGAGNPNAIDVQQGNRNLREITQADYTTLAEQFGATITSRQRSPEHNRKVGGVANSQHLIGTAADFVVPDQHKAAFKAEAAKRGYQVIDEGDHVHLELPGHHGKAPVSSSNVAERQAERQRRVDAGELEPGVATAEDAFDQARADRGLPLEPTAPPAKPAPEPTKAAAPPAALPGMGIADLLEQHRSALADANDKLRTPEERRAAKRRAQYLMSEIEAQNAKPQTGLAAEIEDRKNQMLDAVTAQSVQGEPVQGAAPETAPAAAPEQVAPAVPAAQAAPQQAPAIQPYDAAAQPPVAPVAPQAQPEPAMAGEVLPPQQAPSVWQAVGEARSPASEAVRYALNKDPGLLSAALTEPHARTFAQARPLAEHEVVEVQLEPQQQQQLQRLGTILGRRIIPYSLKTPGGTNLVGLAFDSKHIFINVAAAKESDFSLIGLIGHEFTHTLRKQGSAMMESLIQFAKMRINAENSYVKQQWRNYSSAYAGRRYTPQKMTDVFTEELVADLIGDIISDEQFWAELAQHDKPMFRRLLKQFISFLRELADRAKRLGDDGAFHEIEKVRARAATMLRSHINDVARGMPQPQVESGAPMAKLGEETPEQQRERIAREVRIDRGTKMAHSYFERGEYHPAAREAAAVSDTYAPPVEIDTPEKLAFFKDSSRKVNREDKAAVFFHGTARDITSFRPKQGDAVFLAQESQFTAPYTAASQHWVNLHGQQDIEVDGQSMREVREQHTPGSVDYVVADLMLHANGDVDKAKELLQDYVYLTHASMDPDLESLDSDTEDKVVEALDQIAFLEGEQPGFVQKMDDAIKSGMNVMPLVTNAKNPWDFNEKSHVKRLVENLRDIYRTPDAMRKAMKMPQKFEGWDHVERSLARGNWTLIEDTGAGIPQLIKDMGFDSYYVEEEGFKNLAVFDPKQVKAAYGNVGAFGARKPTAEEAAALGMTLEEAVASQEQGDIRLRLGTMLAQTFTNGLYNDGTREQLERWFLDEYRDVRDIQKIIARQTLGGRIPPNMDAHRNENLRHGAYQDARTRAEERFIKPIARAISKAGATMNEFSDYLWWRHAGERDAYLRNKLDPQIAQGVAADALAGIDPAEAARNIAALSPEKRRAFERAAKFIDGMRHFTLDTLVNSGQITHDHYQNVLAQYQHYVPLRGMPDGSDVVNAARGGARGLSMNKKALGQRAAGRKSKPQNIIEEMMRDMDNALVGQQKQRVLESLVRLIAAHPDPDLWEIQPVASERKWVNGVLTVVQTNGKPEDQITFMHRGIPVRIEIRHEGMRKAMLNLNEPAPKLIRSIGRVTRWLSAVKTSFSPFFLLVNPVRDGGLAIMGVGAEHGMGALRDMAKFYPHAWTVLARDQKRKVAPHANPIINQLQQYAREFAAVGGKTGYTYVADIREQQHKLQHLMDRYANSKGMRDIIAGNFDTKDAALIARKALQHTAHAFEVVNDMAENSTRLAVYAAMREKGLSVEDAAAYAKEVTVNFNRRGAMGKWLNGFYMFFNAAMQGGARLARLMKNRKFQAMMGSLVASSYAMALGQMLAAGDDDDGESKYDKAISDGQAQRSISFMLGNGKSFALPVPYGPNIFSYIGYRMAKLTYDQMRGKRPSYGKATGDIITQALTSMSPIDPGKGLQAFLPEFVRIAANAQQNRNDFGGKITYKVDPFDSTGNPLYPKSDVKTGAPYRWLAQALNTATGGTTYRGGVVNWSAEQTRYVAEQVGGGMMRMATESWELAENLLAGVDPEPSDVPLANVYLRGHGAEQVRGSYYDNLDDYQNTVADWKLAVANDDQAAIERILKRAPWIEGAEADASTKGGREAQAGSVMEAKRGIDRQMRKLRDEQSAILADKTLDWRERKRQAREIDLEIAELQKDFNYEINAGRGYPSTQR